MLSTLLPDPVRTLAPAQAAPPARWRLHWLPLLLVGALYIGACVGPAIFDQNEAQYAGAAREMLDQPGDYLPGVRGQLERGQWLVPTNDGIPRLQKPPLVYWTLMASMRVFGVNEFGARLPNALAALLWFGGTILLGRRLGGWALGASAALILATMAGSFLFSHLIAPEPFLAAFLTLTYWCFLRACQEPERAAGWMRLAWLFMALGAFCKGLHGLFYPLAVAGVLAWRHPQTRPAWRQLLRPAGPLIFAAILVPWYAAVEWKYPGFLRDQLLNEQLGHVFNRRYPPDNVPVPFLVFWLQHLALFLPWTFFIPAAIRARSSLPGPEPSGALGRDLLAAWLGVTVLSILFSSMQDYYLMTAWGPVAFWLAGPWAGRRQKSRLPAWTMAVPGAAFACLGLTALGLAWWLASRDVAPGAGNVDNLTAGRDGMWSVVVGFSAATWGRLLPLLWAAGGILLAGGLASIFLARRGRFDAVLPASALMMTALLLLAARGLCALEDYFSLKQAALEINGRASPKAWVVCHGLPIDNPSLLFYLDREVHWVGANPAGEFASRELKIGADLFLSEEKFARLWASEREVYLIIEQTSLPHWRETLSLTPAQLKPVAHAGTRLALVNHWDAIKCSLK
jgi:4-amino-4-deoxy-L-arabinose transferase-like glycosyltransferase